MNEIFSKDKIQAVIFDSDGMLTRGTRFSDLYMQEFGISFDIMEPFFDNIFPNCLIGKADLKEELSKDWLKKWKWNSSVDELVDYWVSTSNTLDNNVYETIPAIIKNGAQCVLATNQEKYRTEHFIKKFNYNNIFEKVFSSAYLGSKKPESDFFDEIINYLKQKDPSIKKENVLFWDDDIKNVEGARVYGFKSEIFSDFDSYKSKMIKYKLIN